MGKGEVIGAFIVVYVCLVVHIVLTQSDCWCLLHLYGNLLITRDEIWLKINSVREHPFNLKGGGGGGGYGFFGGEILCWQI